MLSRKDMEKTIRSMAALLKQQDKTIDSILANVAIINATNNVLVKKGFLTDEEITNEYEEIKNNLHEYKKSTGSMHTRPAQATGSAPSVGAKIEGVPPDSGKVTD